MALRTSSAWPFWFSQSRVEAAVLAESRLGDITTTICSANWRIPLVADSKTPVPVSSRIRL
jgi:hypothetical protein